MQAWHFTEMPYPHFPPDAPTIRVNLPSAHFDPKIGADLYNRYLDEHMIADELGLDIMLNEHHQTPTCIDTAAPLNLAILARQTKRARLLILGNPVGHRNDPVRVAEEMAMIDCISYGRLEAGFGRGVPYEVFASNANPTFSVERLWEGIDLCIKAWTTTDGPFNYEGEFWHRRSINLWPRPLQTPHPQIWITGSNDLMTPRRCAERGYVFATFLLPYQRVRPLFDAYRERFVEHGLPGGGGLAYMPLVHTADSDSEAEAGAAELRWYLTSSRSEPHFRDPPGYLPVSGTVAAMKQAMSPAPNVRQGSLEQLREQGVLMSGTPDKVAAQIKRFYDLVGGFDHLLMMDHAGLMNHERTVRSMTLFAREVYPQIKDLPRTRPLRTARQAAE
jgi:alkanesulfonate monooxygenase SsuD/methylene tetrahydromethanopterin reductase-like flavin-dependent oxidoreductase (luciferase family)